MLRANNGGGEDQSDSSYTNRSYFFVNFGFPGSITEDAGPSIGAYMQFSGGWAMNPHLMLGGGFSMVRMTNGFIPTSHVPVFAEIRGDFKTKRPWAFTYSLALGYDIAILDTTVTTSVWTANDRQMLAAKGGLYIRPELGIRFAGKKSIRWHMGFGYQVIRASYEMNINNTFLKTEQWMIRPHLSVGILF